MMSHGEDSAIGIGPVAPARGPIAKALGINVEAEPFTVRVRDREIRGYVSKPDVVPPGLAPVLVIAPGQGYHMDLPLTRGLFDAIAAEGWLAARFDWSFHTAKRKEPSPGYVDEVEELQAVLDCIRALKVADRSRFYVAGKSLGSGIALERAAADPSIRGVILLTPPIHSPKPEYKMGTVRPRLEKLRQPSLIVIGERDPICELGRLYTVLADLQHAPHLAVVGGDHSMRASTELEALRNVDLALAHAVDWLRRQASR